jgi:hypothetical protein
MSQIGAADPVLPDEAGIGATPACIANRDSVAKRLMPAVSATILAAVVGAVRLDGLDKAYYQRRRANRDTSMEALRASNAASPASDLLPAAA